MSFLISIIVFAVSVFLLAVSARYGLIGARRLDEYFSNKNNSSYNGFQLYYRIPFSIGVIPEYFYAMVLGHESYFTKNWWALKTSSFISILVFIATLSNRSAVYSYYSLGFLQDKGIIGIFTSGTFVNFMNIITLLYIALFALICIESINMHGKYAPIRITIYSMLCLIMANLTVITLSIIIFVAIVYLVIKIVWLLFFSSKRRRRRNRNYEDEEGDETAGTILSGGFKEFKTDLLNWEEDDNNSTSIKFATAKTPDMVRKRPKITRRRRKRPSPKDDEIPRLHPD
ncbi:MAG: hypothetical protein HQ521_00845 [Bacteroidetes bacterium]|nr:hypothetical protein [Bacteroidota bacterium]